MSKKNAAFILDNVPLAYSPSTQRALGELFHFPHLPMNARSVRENLALLSDVQIVFSGWGGPRMDQEFLDAAPRLEAVFFGAGSVRGIASDDFWKRSIPISSAWVAIAIPVAEFTFAQIILALKQAYRLTREMHAKRQWLRDVRLSYGAYGSKVGLIGLGMIGRMVAEHLKTIEVEVLASDPFFAPEKAAELGVRLVDLATLFAECQVVSLHAPWIKATEGMITGAHFKGMREGATFINTSRGRLVREEEMIEVLRARPDLMALLDVTDPEPPASESPLYDLPNVFLTPHIAGCAGEDCWRMGDYMLEEVRRYLKGEPLHWLMTEAAASGMT